MRYKRLKDTVRFAVRLQAASGGFTLDDIADAARVFREAGNFGVLGRKRQAAFRKGLTAPSEPITHRHDY